MAGASHSPFPTNVTRRTVLKTLSGAVAASLAPKGNSEAQTPGPASTVNRPGRPNILWITGEGIPNAALSCYGSDLIQTPNIDRIANEGIRFDNAFTTNALCAPSRATLLTGTYTHINGMICNPSGSHSAKGESETRFDAAQQTIAKILQANGYQTGMVGKWHLPITPADAGFDYFIYKDGAGGPYYEPSGYRGNSSLGNSTVQNMRFEGYETDVFTDLAIEGIRKFDKPFLMMVQYFNAHRPFEPPHKYENLFANKRFKKPGTFWDDYSHRATAARTARTRIEDMSDFHPPAGLTPRQRKQWNYQQFMEHFLGTLKSQDDNIGRLLDFLHKNGLAENTVVIYTTDHGFFLGDHGWFDKRFMYDQAIRVPWMVRIPWGKERGVVRTEWTSNIDNAPTVLDLAGIPVPKEMQGESLVPLFEGQPAKKRPAELYYHYYEFGSPHWVAPHYGIRTDRYKLIYYYTRNEWELFDLEKDPDEMDNLIVQNGLSVEPEYKTIVQNLAQRLEALRAKYKDNTGAPVRLLLSGN